MKEEVKSKRSDTNGDEDDMIDTVESKRYTKFMRIFGSIFGGIGVIFLAAGIVMYILNFSNTVDKGNPVFWILGTNFSILGGTFGIIGGTFLCIVISQKKKIARLMREGKCYEAKIINMYFNLSMRMNRRSPLICECVYELHGKNCLVKSGNVWIDGLYENTYNSFNAVKTMPEFAIREEDIKAKVWVNPKNPKDYFVDIYADRTKANGEAGLKIDYDYR